MFDLYDEFRRLIQALESGQIEYALCGGIAMAIYAHPRATVDIDLLIASESLNEVIVIAGELGYTIRGLDMTFADGDSQLRRVRKITTERGMSFH
jgi:hypothetical protein